MAIERIFYYDRDMFDVFLAELLILALILITALRIFFTKHVRIDATVILAPISFVLSLLLLYVWGADILILLLCVLSFFTFFINIRSLLRLSARLYVDHYNLRFTIPTLIITLLALGTMVITVIFHPVRYKPNDFGVAKTRTALTGNFATGYRAWNMFSDRPQITGVLYEYAPSENSYTSLRVSSERDTAPIILFVPKCTATAMQYEPYFLMLAQRGYRVLSADFNSSDRNLFDHSILNSRFFRRLYSLYLREFKEDSLRAALDADASFATQGYAQLTRFALTRYGADASVFLALEHISSEAAQTLADQFAPNVLGAFWLNRIDEYKTPGFGFIEQTDPLLAHIFGMERDASFFIPRYVAGKTAEAILQAQKLAAPPEIVKADETEGDAQ